MTNLFCFKQFGSFGELKLVFLNHMYNIAHNRAKVKKNIRLFYCTIPARAPPSGAKLLIISRLCYIVNPFNEPNDERHDQQGKHLH